MKKNKNNGRSMRTYGESVVISVVVPSRVVELLSAFMMEESIASFEPGNGRVSDVG